ncbi:hypothetical protein [uncultured Psychrobacter sp.]|uniref:hypothetical protein n=1 Tax=uncultured Psychrobacter sp. TaxID=259303 RepID=UPI0025965DD5|nr:hypothetical protein [uncultured Psychrobacter sp.]
MDDIKKNLELATQRIAIPPLQTLEALRILEKLNSGINPFSNQALESTNLCVNINIKKALRASILALEATVKGIKRQAQLHVNSDKPPRLREETEILSLTAISNSQDHTRTIVKRYRRLQSSIPRLSYI